MTGGLAGLEEIEVAEVALAAHGNAGRVEAIDAHGVGCRFFDRDKYEVGGSEEVEVVGGLLCVAVLRYRLGKRLGGGVFGCLDVSDGCRAVGVGGDDVEPTLEEKAFGVAASDAPKNAHLALGVG